MLFFYIKNFKHLLYTLLEHIAVLLYSYKFVIVFLLEKKNKQRKTKLNITLPIANYL